MDIQPMQIPVKTAQYVSLSTMYDTFQLHYNSQALCSGLTATPMMMRAPAKTPATPMPATARPTMSMVEEVATPQMREPSSKMKKKAR